MSNDLSYHRKYRPSRISDYIGNTRLVASIMAMMKSEVRPQVLLFQGHSGCGKTTMARIVAKEYMCEDRDEVKGACNECENCRLTDSYIETGDDGVFMNLREYDLAHNGGKDVVNEIIEDANTPTIDGSWRILILDECHMATKHAQNSLLKLAEEPPAKVLLIFCTTDPEQMIVTLLNRCNYKFNVIKPTKDEMVTLLARVCKKEGVMFDDRGLSIVAVKSNFVPRQALEDLQMVVTEKSSVTGANALEVLSVVANTYFYDFYKYLLNKNNVFEYVAFLGKLRETIDLKSFINALIDFTVKSLYVSNGQRTDGLDKSEITTMCKIFNTFERQEIVNLLTDLIDLRKSNLADVESKLLLLGYKGLKRDVIVSSAEVIYPEGNDSSNFKAVLSENVRVKTEYSEEEVTDIVVRETKPLSTSDAMSLFNATIVLPK